jgi:thioredoxin 2
MADHPDAALADGRLILACPACGQKNSVPLERLGSTPICGACKVDLPPPSAPVQVDDEGLELLVARSPLPVLVDFWGPQCGPCRMLAPILERFAARRRGQVLVAKVDTSRHTRAAMRLQVQAIPLLVLFRQGREIRRQAGLVPERVLDALLEG